METLWSEFNVTSVSTRNASDPRNDITVNPDDQNTANFIYTLTVSSVELPLICLAVHAVYVLVKSGQAAPVFVINLLISDMVQIVGSLCIDTSLVLQWPLLHPGLYMFFWAFLANLYFMTCISVERYVLIAHSVWHRSHNSVKCLVYVSLAGWFASLILLLFRWNFNNVFLLLLYIVTTVAYIIIVMCFARAYRILSRSRAVTSLKKQLVLVTLLFVLLSYTFLILPYNVALMLHFVFAIKNEHLIQISEKLLMITPLVDCILYVFMRTDVPGSLRRCCCPRLNRSSRRTSVSDVRHHCM